MASLAVHDPDSASAGFPRTRGLGTPWRGGWWKWLLFLLVVLALGALLAVVCHARPAYDAFGWLVWGHQVLHGTLNLDGAPSWKPLSFVFTLPYSLFGRSAALWMWIITACAGAVAAPLLAGRIAFRLAPRGAGWMPWWIPPGVAAIIACGATATMTVAAKSTPIDMGLLRQVLIVTSDPLMMALWLLAIDAHISRRPGWALGLLWLTALGRPEAWPFLGLYALWLWWKHPGLRLWSAVAILAVPLAWFLAPGLASHSWMSASDLDMNQPTAITGNKVTGVMNRVRELTGTAIQIEVAAAALLSLLRRDKAVLGLLGLSVLWTAVEIAFALHGLSAVQRYMIEAGAPLAIIGGIGAAYALALPTLSAGPVKLPLGVIGVVAVIGFGVAVEPFGHDSVNAAKAVIENQKLNSAEIDGLDRLMAKVGNPKALLACGAPAASLGWQSGLAWQLNLDVADVGYRPASTYRNNPVVYFTRDGTSWSIKLLNEPADMEAQCSRFNGLAS